MFHFSEPITIPKDHLETRSPVRSEAESRVWFIDAPTDLLFCCGGLLWIIVGLHATFVSRAHAYALAGPKESFAEQGMAFILLAGSYLFTYSHHAATWVRLYGSEKSRRKYWYCSYLLPVILCAVLLAAVYNPKLLPWLVQITLAWNFQHWIAQSYGIGLIYLSRAKFALSNLDRKLLWICCQLLIVVGIVKSEVFSSTEITFVNGTFSVVPLLPKWLISPLELSAFAIWTPICIYLVCKWIKLKKLPPLAATVMAITIVRIVLNSSSSCVNLLVYGLPFFHSLQYLVVSSRFNISEHNIFPSREFPSLSIMIRSPKLVQYVVLLVLMGWLAYGGSQLVLEKLGMSALLPSFVLYMVILLNNHHVISDAFIWKLKDPEVGKHF